MKHLISLLCFFIVFFLSCKKNVPNTDVESETSKIITLSSIEESFQDTTYFKKPKITVLETTDESLLTERIDRIITDDSLLFIFDGRLRQVFVFDITGKFINKIDRKGQGPNEYVQICDFTIDTDKKQIILSADIPSKLMYFTYDCVFVKEEHVPSFFFKLVMDGTFMYADLYMANEKNQIHILDTEKGIKKGRVSMRNIGNYVGIKGNTLSRGKDVLFVRRYDNYIYELKNGEITTKYLVNFKNHSFPERFIKETNENLIFIDSNNYNYIYAMSNAFNSDNYMTFYTNIGIFMYDKNEETLKGYKKVIITHLNYVMHYYFFKYYLPLENTGKMVFIVNDPSLIKSIASLPSDDLMSVSGGKSLAFRRRL